MPQKKLCKHCGKAIRKFRTDKDWEHRKYHKSCLKYVDGRPSDEEIRRIIREDSQRQDEQKNNAFWNELFAM